jgi:4'-phosphopantetheinyl transferase
LAYIPVTMPASSLTQRVVPETGGDTWPPGPLRPRLGDGAVHVWRADLTAVSDGLVEVLSPDERARAERFLNARDGRLWARSHGVLRVLLGRYLDADPAGLRFAAGEHGKPALIDDVPREPARAEAASPTAGRLSLNLSHSGQLAVYAFSKAGAVGVDVEVARRPIDVGAIAGRAFSAAEARRLELLDPATREQEFLRAWVRYEAERKWQGTGIGAARASAARRPPWIAGLHVGPRAAAAVVLDREPHALLCWEWTA